MRILYHAKNYLPSYCAGDSVNAHTIHLFLISHGHEVIVMRGSGTEPYEIDGVKVLPKNPALYAWADIVCTCLDFTQATIDEVGKMKPIIFYMHNTFYEITLSRNPHVSIIYNSQHTKDNCGFVNDGFVLPPPVDPDYYNVSPGNCSTWNNEFITLINCNPAKGSEMFGKLAAAMPQERFLAVKGGYGDQNAPDLPNVEIWETQSDSREIYRQTRILLCMSLYESWGRGITEAMCNGIPVISTRTFGTNENIGENGIFIEQQNSIELWMAAINKLKDKKEYDKYSENMRKRSIELNPKEKLEGLENFMKKKVVEHTKKRECIIL